MKSKTKLFTFNPISSDTKTIIKAYKKPLWIISFLMGVLIFVMNVFLAGALYGNKFNDQMKDKLGIYIYLSDVASNENQAIALKSSLEKEGLKVTYSSKKEALKLVEKRIPDLTTTLKKYKLHNPLPATLYIRYNNENEFGVMKEVLEKNKNQILNLNDLSDNAIKRQEARVLNVINLSNFLQSFAYGVVISLIVIIIAFAIFFLRAIFSHFIHDIQAKKLIGATSRQIIQPFLNVIFIALGLAFLLSIILLLGGILPMERYIGALLDFSLLAYIQSIGFDILAVAIIEIGIIMALLMGISYRFIWRLHKKLK